MGFLIGLLLVLLVISSLVLILLVLIQTGKGSTMGIMGGASQTAFGSSSADVLTKATRVAASSFVLFALFLSFLFSKRQEILPENTNPESSIIKPKPEATPSVSTETQSNPPQPAQPK